VPEARNVMGKRGEIRGKNKKEASSGGGYIYI
jgi:hypothetical protein